MDVAEAAEATVTMVIAVAVVADVVMAATVATDYEHVW